MSNLQTVQPVMSNLHRLLDFRTAGVFDKAKYLSWYFARRTSCPVCGKEVVQYKLSRHQTSKRCVQIRLSNLTVNDEPVLAVPKTGFRLARNSDPSSPGDRKLDRQNVQPSFGPGSAPNHSGTDPEPILKLDSNQTQDSLKPNSRLTQTKLKP